MTQPIPPTTCPNWCDRRHIPGWHIHTADIGQVEIGDLDEIRVLVGHGDDNQPHIAVDFHDKHAEELETNTLNIRQAQQLYLLLGEALETLGEQLPERDAEPTTGDEGPAMARVHVDNTEAATP